MTRTITLVGLLILLSTPAFSRQRAQGWCEQGNKTVQITNGLTSITRVQGSYPACTVTVYLTGTSTLATLYSDNSGTAKANPFTADSTGLWFWYADNGRYDVRLSGAGIAAPFTLGDISLADPANPAFSVTANQIYFGTGTTLGQSSSLTWDDNLKKMVISGTGTKTWRFNDVAITGATLYSQYGADGSNQITDLGDYHTYFFDMEADGTGTVKAMTIAAHANTGTGNLLNGLFVVVDDDGNWNPGTDTGGVTKGTMGGTFSVVQSRGASSASLHLTSNCGKVYSPSQIVVASNVGVATLGTHYFIVGDSMKVAGVTGDADLNATYTITAITSTTVTFTTVNVSNGTYNNAGITAMTQVACRSLGGIEINTANWVNGGTKVPVLFVDYGTGVTPNDANYGLGFDVADGNAEGYHYGIKFGGVASPSPKQPVKGTAIIAGAGTMATAIDFTRTTFSSDAILMPGFTVGATGLTKVYSPFSSSVPNLIARSSDNDAGWIGLYNSQAGGAANSRNWSLATNYNVLGEMDIMVSGSSAGAPITRVATFVGSSNLLGMRLAPTTHANLGTPSSGTFVYCSDCTVTGAGDNTCASGGNGAFGARLNGVWRCFNAQN